MLKKIPLIITASIIFSFTAWAAFDPNDSQLKENCILLTSDPSLIIKFKNNPSSFTQNNKLSSSFLANLSNPAIHFTSSTIMSGGAYIVHFVPKEPLPTEPTEVKLVQTRPGCYTPESLNKLIADLKKRGDIEYVDANSVSQTMSIETNPAKTVPVPNQEQWNLLTPPSPTAGPAGVNVAGAWPITMGNANVVTAVLDTGIFNNDSLNPNLLPGVHFTNNGTENGPGAAPSCPECSAADHGTHVAGTVAASGILAYGKNVYGVAPTSKVIPINVFTKFTSPVDCAPGPAPCLRAFNSDQTNALNWLSGTETIPGVPMPPAGIQVLNMSLGGQGACPVSNQNAFNNIFSKSIVSIIASGNSDQNAANFSPANCNNIIAIAATGPTGLRAYYSNFGEIVKIAAPGGDFETPFPVPPEIYSTIANGYGYKQGTSMASPHVAGVAALLKSVNPALTPTQILSIMQTTATPFAVSADPQKSCVPPLKACGAGIVNAGAAVQKATQIIAPNLTTAIRNPMDKTQAFVFFDRLGPFQPGITKFSVNGSPGATATLDVARQRILVSTIISPRAVTITITLNNGGISITSNPVIIPAILG